MKDVVYFGKYPQDAGDFREQLSKDMPCANMTEDDDPIKGIRLSVDIPEEEVDNYYMWLMAYDWFAESLSFRMMTMNEVDAKKLDKLLDDAVKKYPDIFKNGDAE